MPDRIARIRRVERWLLWGTAIVLAVFISWFLNVYWQRDSLIKNCLRNSHFKLLAAQGWSDAAETRRQSGDYAAAKRYGTIAYEMIRTIPYPSDGIYPVNAHDIKRGCQQAYPPLVSFIQ